MTYHENLKILILTSQNSVISAELTHYLTEKGYPKIDGEDTVSQATHLAEAGQHRIVTSAVHDFDEYHALQHEFPGEVILVGIASPADIERYETNHDDGKPRKHLVEIADHYIPEAGTEQMHRGLHALLEDIGFLN